MVSQLTLVAHVLSQYLPNVKPIHISFSASSEECNVLLTEDDFDAFVKELELKTCEDHTYYSVKKIATHMGITFASWVD